MPCSSNLHQSRTKTCSSLDGLCRSSEMRMSKLVCQEESMDQCQSSVASMLNDHWNEVALHKSHIPLAPNWSAYKHLEDAGVLRIFTAREDGALVGYAVFLVQKHLHY